MCRRGFSDMKTILKNLSDDRLRAYIVWLPTLKSDNQAQAEIRITEFADTRLRYFWDGHNATGTLWQGVLGLKVVPWDIYLLYSPDGAGGPGLLDAPAW